MARFFLLLCLALSVGSVRADDTPKRIHLFVALCDNASQGIQPVGARIGNGDDPDANLYWGCDDGAGAYFARSKLWTTVDRQKDVSDTLLRRSIFRHKKTGALLVADAYRGRAIKACMTDFLAATEGRFAADIAIKGNGTQRFGAEADLVAYIGHNGLMEFSVASHPAEAGKRPDSIVLCCVSERYFADRLQAAGSRPLLLTRQLMYPGAFLLHDAIEGWLLGESRPKLRDRAADAYVKNQKISFKAARGIFAELE